jgi:hypothetical protein
LTNHNPHNLLGQARRRDNLAAIHLGNYCMTFTKERGKTPCCSGCICFSPPSVASWCMTLAICDTNIGTTDKLGSYDGALHGELPYMVASSIHTKTSASFE